VLEAGLKNSEALVPQGSSTGGLHAWRDRQRQVGSAPRPRCT